MKISRRGNEIAPFYAMEVLKAANDRQAAGGEVFHMEVGEPGGGAPEPVIAAAREALGTAHLGYTEALGIPELRARIVRHYDEYYGVSVDFERVIVTAGSSGAFPLAFMAAFENGDRVALVAPGYPAYRNILLALDLEPVSIATGPESRFQPTPELLAAAGPLDGLLIASPANPTGTMLDRPALEALIAYCRQHGIRLISDEVYHGITYGRQAETLAGLWDQAVVINSFSKYFAMTGWRLGWMVVPEDLVRPLERLSQNLYISPPALSQHAAVVAFDCRTELDDKVAEYARNRELLLAELPQAGFDRLAPADGAFYIFADVAKLTNDSADFCRRMLEETGVASTPGIDFDTERGHAYLRFSFAGPHADMVEATRRLKAWLG
jgi:aspartate/methionine/tyrosine aminotransferase